MRTESMQTNGSYQNPVYPFSCADPFVMKYLGEYWCYSTGFESEGKVFPILHSTDLVHWVKTGSAMQALPGKYSQYWAPEVTYWNGIFLLYYSVGDGTKMHIRVATADQPAGPFTDSGRSLTPQDFAIDGHVFTDDDGSRYFFYATDFLDVERVGTGTVMDRMLDPFTLAGNPVPVTRAKFDWQIFDPQREEKGGVCWHTVEGPFVLKRHKRYFQMFSGGNWQNDSYGVAYGISDHLDRDDEWEQVCDGEETQPILRSIPEQGIIGPGHNSVVRGPDCRELFIVYHRWSKEVNARVMAIDRMGWEGDRLVVHGPTSTPQPMPARADVSGFAEFVGEPMTSNPAKNELRMSAEDHWTIVERDCAGAMVLEVSMKITRLLEDGQVRISLLEGSREVSLFDILKQGESPAEIRGTGGQERLLPDAFVLSAFHLIRLEIEDDQIHWFLDGMRVLTQAAGGEPGTIRLACRQSEVTWAAFSMTAT